MKTDEFHRLRQEVLRVEGEVIGIARCIVGRAVNGKMKKNPQSEILLAGDVSDAHAGQLREYSKRRLIAIPDWKAHNYTSKVYGQSRMAFDNARTGEYNANAAARTNVVRLISEHFGLFNEPYVLNVGTKVPEGMEMPAKWANLHTKHSLKKLSADLDMIAQDAFVEMRAAIAQGADPAEVIDIHRQKLYDWIESKCLNVDTIRVDRYVGEIYRCGVFVPSKVDKVTAEDKEQGKITYRQRLHTGCKAATLLADEFPVTEHKIPDAA